MRIDNKELCDKLIELKQVLSREKGKKVSNNDVIKHLLATKYINKEE